MAIRLVSNGPSDFVGFLTRPGMQTSGGNIPLHRYVSGSHRSPRAAAALALFNGILSRFVNSDLDATPSAAVNARHPARAFDSPASMADAGAPATHAAAMNALERVRSRVINHHGGVRPSNWRRIFTGQGMPENILLVWEYILTHREFLCSLQADQLHAGSAHPFQHYFSLGNPVKAMVADEIFGYDCLGFVGNYLHWAGLQPHYPECSQAQYITRLGFEPVARATDIVPLSVVLWLTTRTQHIAIIDRVHEAGPDTAVVDLCQSSRGGPQTNVRASLTIRRGETIAAGSTSMQAFRVRTLGTPAMPVTGTVTIARNPNWQLARPGR